MSYYWQEKDAEPPTPGRNPGEPLEDYIRRLAIHLGYMTPFELKPAKNMPSHEPKPATVVPFKRDRQPGEDDE